MKKLRVLAVLAIVLVLSITCLTTPAHAASASGTCGDNLTWTLVSGGTLTISGTGAMYDYGYQEAPWYPYDDSIRNVVIQSGVTSVGAGAFEYCYQLTSVTLSNSVTSIGNYAFCQCERLSSINIPDSVTSIGDDAFWGCESLTSVTIPNSVISIGVRAFASCVSLPDIHVDNANSQYISVDGVLYTKDTTTIVCYPGGRTGAYQIPYGVTSIGDDAFWGCESLTSVTIPNSVTSIGNSAFYDCESLTSVTIPNSVSSIGSNAFKECESLTSVTIPDGVTYIAYGLFAECDKLTNVTLPNGVTVIGERAFYSCNALTSITLPNSVTSIGEAAFMHSDLTSITIPSSVTLIDAGAFKNNRLTSITIPSSVTKIGAEAFGSSLKTIVFAGNKPKMSSTAFKNSTVTAYYPGDNSTWSGIAGQNFGGTITWVANNSNANIVAAGTCGDNVTWILDSDGTLTISGSGAMYDYEYQDAHWYPYEDSIRKAVIQSGVTSIGSYAFSDCDSLTSVTIPSSVKSIETYAFGFCGALSKVQMPSGVTSIGKHAFSECIRLSSITIPNSVTTIGSGAFELCGLKDIVFTGNMPAIGKEAFLEVVAIARYPMNNATWEGIEGQNFGGTITWKEYKPLALKSEPKTGYAKMGETVKVSVKAEGDGLTYQWYIKNASASKYTKSSVTKSTYTATMSDKVKGRKVYCVITDLYGNSVQSKTVLLREAASIVTEPKTTYAKSGKTAKVSVEASGDELTYQWYIKNAGAEKYSKSSITSDTYSVKMSDKIHGRRAYCVVKDKYGKTAQSETVILRMAATITTQPKSVTVEKGETAKVTVKATGDGLKYQWYVKNKGADSFSKSSVTKSTYSVEMSDKTDGRKVYCVVTDKYGKTAKSDTATLTMKVTLEITSQPKSVRVDKGETAKVTVKATGKDLTYTWYYMNAGQTKFSKSSVTKSTYSVEMSNKVSGRQVYCVVKDASGKKLQTNTVILNITGGPEITTQPKNQTVAYKDHGTVSVAAKGKGLTYEWYFKGPKDSEYRLSAAGNKDTYGFLMLEDVDGRKVFCVITDSSGRKTTSKTITIKLA